MIKVYHKKGARNYKESRLVAKLQAAIEKKIAENPEFASTFKPATNMAQLQQLHDQYCVETVEYEDVKTDSQAPQETPEQDTYKKHQEFRDSAKETMKNEEPKETNSGQDDKWMNDDSNFVDPLNREEPIVRDYVMHDEFAEQKASGNNNSFQKSFDEPKSFKDSFEIPDDNASSSGQQTSTGGSQKKEKKEKQQISEPINPNFDEMNNGKKKKSTRKFAKYIVETVCMLSEKGFVWFANKDINENKLAEYELSNEMDLSLLLSLEDGQQITVKQFFQMQCMRAEQLSKIDQEEKNDLADALAEVLLEKGVGPTPTQELMLIALKIFGGQAIALLTLKSQTNSVLNQLRAMKEEQSSPARPSYTPPQPAPPVKKEEVVQTYETENVSSASDIDEDREMQTQLAIQMFERMEQNEIVNDDLGVIEGDIQTKE